MRIYDCGATGRTAGAVAAGEALLAGTLRVVCKWMVDALHVVRGSVWSGGLYS